MALADFHRMISNCRLIMGSTCQLGSHNKTAVRWLELIAARVDAVQRKCYACRDEDDWTVTTEGNTISTEPDNI